MKNFGYALSGILDSLKNEKSFRIQLCFAFYVIFAGFVTRLSPMEWAIVFLCIGLVLGLECLNTGLERLCDAVCREKNPHIKLAKDAAAGAVLLSALFAAIAGCLIFFQAEKLLAARKFFEKPGLLAAAILPLIPLGLFARGGRRKRK